jgi:Uma2 family endonuclease
MAALLIEAPQSAQIGPHIIKSGARMTLEEFDEWYLHAEDTIHAEWANGETIFKMPDNQKHNGIGVLLTTLFSLFVRRKKLGRVYGDHFQLRLPGNLSRREPDLSFVAKDRLDIGQETFMAGPPDLAIEIVSPDSVTRDTVEKIKEYAAGGIREFWLINPMDNTVAAFLLDKKGKYKRIAEKDGKIDSQILAGFYIRPEWLWNALDLDPIELLAEMGVV